VTRLAARAAPWAIAFWLCACRQPPPQCALRVRDPDKLCRLIVFSRCSPPLGAQNETDGGPDL
jgi:hypothetical protein